MRPHSMQTWLQNARNPISEDLRLKTSLGDNTPRPLYSRTPLAVLILKPPLSVLDSNYIPTLLGTGKQIKSNNIALDSCRW